MTRIVRRHVKGGRDGAIAQLGERVVRNDEVGGSIPPGSTTLRPSGYAWRSHAKTRRAQRARHSPKGDDGLMSSAITATVFFGLRVAQPRKSRRAKRARHSPKGDDGLMLSTITATVFFGLRVAQPRKDPKGKACPA